MFCFIIHDWMLFELIPIIQSKWVVDICRTLLFFTRLYLNYEWAQHLWINLHVMSFECMIHQLTVCSCLWSQFHSYCFEQLVCTMLRFGRLEFTIQSVHDDASINTDKRLVIIRCENTVFSSILHFEQLQKKQTLEKKTNFLKNLCKVWTKNHGIKTVQHYKCIIDHSGFYWMLWLAKNKPSIEMCWFRSSKNCSHWRSMFRCEIFYFPFNSQKILQIVI